MVPLLGTLNNRCRNILGTQKGTIIFDNYPYWPRFDRHFGAKGFGCWKGWGPGACSALVGFLLSGLSYHNKETILFTMDPYYGNLS